MIPLWQVTLHSSVMGFPLRAILGFNLFVEGMTLCLKQLSTIHPDDDDDSMWLTKPSAFFEHVLNVFILHNMHHFVTCHRSV